MSIGGNGVVDESDRLDELDGSDELDESDGLDRLDGLDRSDGLDESTAGGIMSSGVLVDVVDVVVYVLSSGIVLPLLYVSISYKYSQGGLARYNVVTGVFTFGVK